MAGAGPGAEGRSRDGGRINSRVYVQVPGRVCRLVCDEKSTRPTVCVVCPKSTMQAAKRRKNKNSIHTYRIVLVMKEKLRHPSFFSFVKKHHPSIDRQVSPYPQRASSSPKSPKHDDDAGTITIFYPRTRRRGLTRKGRSKPYAPDQRVNE